MSWLNYIFSKKEKYDIKGRKVIIIIRSENTNVKLIREVILEFWDKVLIAKNIPNVVFYIEDFKKPMSHFGKIADAFIETYKKFPKIHINAISLDSKKKLFHIIGHELTHYKTMEFVIIQRKVNARVSKAIKDIKVHDDSRYYFRTFLVATLSEGYAVFAENTLMNKIRFTDAEFLRFYNLAKTEAEEFMDIWNKYIEFDKLKDREGLTDEMDEMITLNKIAILNEVTTLYKRAYKIGFHVNYTMISTGNPVLLETDIFKIIKIYESAIVSRGYKPIISVNSGKGILDYNSLIASWYNLHKNS